MVNKIQSRTQRGFTLIESIVAIVIMAVAMTILISFLLPQLQESGRPQYQVRASTLAQSVMTEVIARGYDHNSDFDGGWERCGEAGALACTTSLGVDTDLNAVPPIDERTPDLYNDVDDYAGCWVTNSASESLCGTVAQKGNLNDVFGRDISSSYPNFVVIVDVDYTTLGGASDTMKSVSITVNSVTYGGVTLTGFRGNY